MGLDWFLHIFGFFGFGVFNCVFNKLKGFSMRKAPLLKGLAFIIVAGLFLAFVLPAFCIAGDTGKKVLPFLPGEKLVFGLKWAFIPAGQAVLEVMPDTVYKGQPAKHFRLTARTNEFVDNFFKVRNVIDAYCDMDMTRTIGYVKEQREGSSIHDVIVEFDWENKVAHFFEDGKLERETPLMEGAFDPLSVFYRFRMESMQPGGIHEIPVTDGKRMVMGKGKVVKRENRKVKAGNFPSVLFEPELTHIGGVFEQSPHAKLQVWLSDDARKIVLRVRSAVVIGSFTAELEEAHNIAH